MEKKTIENMDYNYELYTQIENLKIIREWINDTDILLRRMEKMDINNIQKQMEEAYQNGYKTCMQENDFDSPCTSCEAYQRGVEDVWEAARKMLCMSTEKVEECFGVDESIIWLFHHMNAAEVIEKLKAYEEKQKADDKIKVGDEVEHEVTGLKYIVTKIDESSITLLYSDGSTAVVTTGKSYLKKTGRRFDMERILEEMKK